MSLPVGEREKYQRRRRNDEYAVPTGKLKRQTRAIEAMNAVGLSASGNPVLRDFLNYLCQNPGTFSFKNLTGSELTQQYREANKAGYRLRECFRMLEDYARLDCTDDDLKEGMLRAVGGRWAYITEPLQWEEWIQYIPKDDWANEYRVAGKALLDYVISEKKWS